MGHFFKMSVTPAVSLSTKLCSSGMNHFRNSVLGFAAMVLLMLLASPAVAQEDYKVAYNEGLEAAKVNNLEEARSKFLAARLGALAADDEELTRKSSYYVAQINNRLGNAALKEGNNDRALNYYKEGVELYPEYIRNQYSAGLALKRLGRMDEALEAWKAAAEAQGDRRTSLAAEGAIRDHFIYQASSAVSRSGALARDADRALAALEHSLDFVEPNADYHYYRAVALHIKGQFAEAVAAADEALSMHNGSRADAAKIYFTKGEAHVGAGNRDAAREAFENAAFGSYKASAEHYLSTL